MELLDLKEVAKVELAISGVELVGKMDMESIDHFQKTNAGKTFFGEWNKITKKTANNNMDIDVAMIMRLAGSLISYKKTGKPVGFAFFKQFDPMDLVTKLTPIIVDLIAQNAPAAKSEEEKN